MEWFRVSHLTSYCFLDNSDSLYVIYRFQPDPPKLIGTILIRRINPLHEMNVRFHHSRIQTSEFQPRSFRLN